MTDRPRPEKERAHDQDDRAESRTTTDDVAFGTGHSGDRDDRPDGDQPEADDPSEIRISGDLILNGTSNDLSPSGPGQTVGDTSIGGDGVVPTTSDLSEMSVDFDERHVVDLFAVTEVARVEDADTVDGIE